MKTSVVRFAGACTLGVLAVAAFAQSGAMSGRRAIEDGKLVVGVGENTTLSQWGGFSLTARCTGLYMITVNGIPQRFETISTVRNVVFRYSSIRGGWIYGIGRIWPLNPPLASTVERATLISTNYSGIVVSDLGTHAQVALDAIGWSKK